MLHRTRTVVILFAAYIVLIALIVLLVSGCENL